MKGAREYAQMFATGQYGQLYIVSGEHARGKTFRIFVIPCGQTAVGNGAGNAPLTDAVEVYGVTGGYPGWTETYGWLHPGPWIADFERMVSVARERAKKDYEEQVISATKRSADKREKENKILSGYRRSR